MAEKKCDGCGKKTERKHLGKIRGKYLCKKCRTEARINHRKETISEARIEDELKSLDKEIKNKAQRKCYRKKNPIKERVNESSPPIPKGSIRGKVKQKNKSESYLGFQESQILLSILVKRGLDFEEAKETIKNTKERLKETRDKMKIKNKSEDEIKIKQQKLLEELYNY